MALELGLGLVVHLLDPGGMDAAVLEQLLERQPRDLAAHAVEPGQHDRAGRVVDDEVDAGEVLQRADVAALAADDPPLHVVGGQLHDRDRRLGRVAGGEPLHAHREDVAHAALGVALGLLLDLADAPRGVVAGLLLDLLEQQLLGLGRRQPGDPLELALELPGALTSVGRSPSSSASRLGEPPPPAEPARPLALDLDSRSVACAAPAPDRRRRRTRGGRAHAVRPPVHERSEHDPHRDQCCGTDDFHGRSSPGPSGIPDLSSSFDFGSDRAARAGTNGCRSGASAASGGG